MMLNADKPHLWKGDVERSIDFYNDWFLRCAPATYRQQRASTTIEVEAALGKTDYLRAVTPDLLASQPGVLPMLRMACAPPIARDRLMGLARVSKNLILSMEGEPERSPRVPPRMPKAILGEQLGRVCETIFELADRDLFPWLESHETPASEAVSRAASVVADRLCGATADPIIRNAQEQRQLGFLRNWLESRGYKMVSPRGLEDVTRMAPGTYAIRMNIPVGTADSQVNIPVDMLIQPAGTGPVFPVFIEAKSAGDATNTNKRRKEEAQKYRQLLERFGNDIRGRYVLFLCGYFETGYLGYEAAEGIDWVWEHRVSDLAGIVPQQAAKDDVYGEVLEEPVSYASVDESREARRFEMQRRIDEGRDQLSRNVMGQFSTPFRLAIDIVRQTFSYVEAKNIAFIEPAVGTGVFFSALEANCQKITIRATGIEVDPEYAAAARQIWGDRYTIIEDDFVHYTQIENVRKAYNCLCANPPYVRHHHIASDRKRDLQKRVASELQMQVSGLSGLYVYFLLLADRVLSDGAIASWLIPSEFLSVNYGKVLRDYLLTRVTLLQVHRFAAEDVQFDDALVSSCVVIYRKTKPTTAYSFRFTSGRSLVCPSEEISISSSDTSLAGKWGYLRVAQETERSGMQLGDLFDITRGLATGANHFFIIDKETIDQYHIPREFVRPILPSPRYLRTDVIGDSGDGFPDVEGAAFLLDCELSPDDIRRAYPGLWEYLQHGEAQGVSRTYICAHRPLWYQQERRVPPLFLSTYMGRIRDTNASPFRFILNRSLAVGTNVFLFLYPKPFLQRLLSVDSQRTMQLFALLKGLRPAELLRNGRTYGGGLHKMEPKELRGVQLPELPPWLHAENSTQPSLALSFV